MLVATQGIVVCVLFVKISLMQVFMVYIVWWQNQVPTTRVIYFQIFSNTVTFMWGFAYRLSSNQSIEP